MKLASLALVLSGSLLIAGVADAQDAQGSAYASPSQPVYAQPEASSGAPGTIKDRSAHDRPFQLSAMAYIPWIYGFGIGVKLGAEIPVAKDGFISSINDSVAVEPVLFFAYSTYYGAFANLDANMIRVAPGASFVWNFHLKPQLTVYGAATLAVEVQKYKYDFDTRGIDTTDVRVLFEIAGGVKWNFAEKVALRAELGWYGPRVGVAFAL